MRGKIAWLFCDVSTYFNLHTCSFYPSFASNSKILELSAFFVVLLIGNDVSFLTKNYLILQQSQYLI